MAKRHRLVLPLPQLTIGIWDCVADSRLELPGVGGLNPTSVHVYRRSFLVKIGSKFQSLGKISNISTCDHPVLSGQFQHWVD